MCTAGLMYALLIVALEEFVQQNVKFVMFKIYVGTEISEQNVNHGSVNVIRL